MVRIVDSYEEWRTAARAELLAGTPPAALSWRSASDGQASLFSEAAEPLKPAGSLLLPRTFTGLAKTVARHRSADRWGLLYRAAWRIHHGERHLLQIDIDDDVRALEAMRRAVEHDTYKMRAFVRFRRVEDEQGEQYVAWYRPEHRTLDANEQFFVRRFGGMRWAILTPDLSMAWDMERVRYGPGVPRNEAPPEDAYDELWRAYYSSIYDPSRLKLDAMRAQMPMYRWEDLPESRLIHQLARESRGRVGLFTRGQASAASLIPANASLPVLREAIWRCDACELCALATQPVFGAGPSEAKLLIVGEQPGDEEDRTGQPFAGPAGQVLDAALREAGVDRDSVYLTNAVKAFRHEERGKFRIHQSPKASHIAKCRPWLEAEAAALRPERVVCLGATAAQSVLGRTVQIGADRGRLERTRWGAQVMVTYHPSAVLRAQDAAVSAQIREMLTSDLRLAAR